MGVQDARRAAEQAAREALSGRIDAVGALGLAVERRTQAADGPAAADTKAAELVQAAREQGRALRQAARDEIAAADAAYADQHAAAVAAGWAVDELTELGYPAPPRRRTRTTADSTTATTASDIPTA